MSLERNVNAYSPRGAATLSIQEIQVQIGAGSGTPEEENFVYDPSAHSSGIVLSYQVLSNTRPAVYLNGVRLVTCAEGTSTGGDVAYSDDVGGTTILSFVGDTYSVSVADIIHVVYWRSV